MEFWKNTIDLFLDGEIWKTINDFPDYQISNYGRIKSLKFKKEKIRKQRKNKNRYLYVNLSRNGKFETKYIHILVFESFNNYRLKDDECIHHTDENKLNNNFNNLQIMNISKHNSLHNSGKKHPMFGKKRPEHSKKMSGENHPMFGSKRSGEKSGNHTLTKQKVIKIRKYLDEGILTQKEIAKIFGIRQGTVSLIKTGKRWKYEEI